MSRKGKLTAALSMSLLLCLVLGGDSFGRLVPARAPVAQKKLTGRQAERAKVLYADNCTRCHGADGRGQTAMGRAFGTPNLTDAGWWKKERPSAKRLAASIRDGRNRQRMPAFGQQLSTSDIAALAAFVRTFDGK